jgi:pSer/pThr/pTyr-binding forkhead associated (FHA) protein
VPFFRWVIATDKFTHLGDVSRLAVVTIRSRVFLYISAKVRDVIFQRFTMDACIQHNERSYQIPPGELIRIGSLSVCDIQLANDSFVSRQHCSLSLIDGQVTVVDLRSTHGTFLNGSEVGKTPRVTKDGDTIQVGQTQLKVSIRYPERVGGQTDGTHLAG